MMRSLYSAVTGLKTHQYKMDVISHNVANINTVGFKRSSVNFSSSFSQSLGSATAASEATGRGGQNGSQIGLGVSVGSISSIMTQGSAQTTSNGNDLMINGDGFFIVSDINGYYFTRAGAFEVDAEGNLVDGNGYKVCGWQVVDGEIVQDVVSGINIYDGDKLYSPASATTSIVVDGNLNLSTNPEQVITLSFYDSVGNSYMITATLTFNEEDSKWNLSLDNDVLLNGTETITLELDNVANDFSLSFQDGLVADQENATLTLNIAWDDNPYNSTFEPITIDFSQLTQYTSTVTASSTTVDGNTAGSMTGYSIDSNGIITATYSNGDTRTLAQIVLANFSNPAGLESVGSNLYAATSNSGDFDLIGVEPGALGSSLLSGTLEMSNVDISYEFTEMITTQRGFQAASRLITVGDEMIQTLVNM